uniref:Caspase family p20 domain-containing protein n=1 Tax=Ciona savignyi TaxID=51511 RepID=H2ZDS2_CIOSA
MQSAGDILVHFSPKVNDDMKDAGDVLMSYEENNDKKVDQILTFEDLKNEEENKEFDDTGDTVDGGATPIPTQSQGRRKLKEPTVYRYKMDHGERGCFLIFSQEDFHPRLKLDKRKGSSVDARSLVAAAAFLGFKFVRIFTNLTKSQILELLKKVSKASHAKYDCFACAILSHGGKNDVVYSYDAKMNVQDFTEPFTAANCSSLAGKPKIFLIQACRGNRYDSGAMCSLVLGNTNQTTQEEDHGIIPTQSDFVIAHSTSEDYISWNNAANGSWFIQSFCLCVQRFHALDLIQILTRVTCMVAWQYESSTQSKETNLCKQVPSIYTRLTGEVFFHRAPTATPLPEVEHNVQVGPTVPDGPTIDKERTFFQRLRKSFRSRKAQEKRARKKQKKEQKNGK